MLQSPIHLASLSLPAHSLEPVCLLVCTISWSPFISRAEHAAVFPRAAGTYHHFCCSDEARTASQRRGAARNATRRNVIRRNNRLMRGMNVVTRWGQGGGGGGGGQRLRPDGRRPRGDRGLARHEPSSRGWRRPVHYATTRLYPPWYNERRFSVAPENRRKVQSGAPVVNESTEQREKPSIK